MQYFLWTRSEVFALLAGQASDGIRVLEIGCGAGMFRRHFGPATEYWGVELSADAAAIAAESLDQVLCGSYEDVADRLPDGGFDLVVCNDVIEHMADHEAFLRDIKRKLAPDGKLLGSIPNIRHYSAFFDLVVHADWAYQDAGILDVTHLRFFTRKSLLRCLDEAGYELLRFEGINTHRLSWRPLRHLAQTIFILLMGRDTRHLQFAFLAVPRRLAQSAAQG